MTSDIPNLLRTTLSRLDTPEQQEFWRIVQQHYRTPVQLFGDCVNVQLWLHRSIVATRTPIQPWHRRAMKTPKYSFIAYMDVLVQLNRIIQPKVTPVETLQMGMLLRNPVKLKAEVAREKARLLEAARDIRKKLETG